MDSDGDTQKPAERYAKSSLIRLSDDPLFKTSISKLTSTRFWISGARISENLRNKFALGISELPEKAFRGAN